MIGNRLEGSQASVQADINVVKWFRFLEKLKKERKRIFRETAAVGFRSFWSYSSSYLCCSWTTPMANLSPGGRGREDAPKRSRTVPDGRDVRMEDGELRRPEWPRESLVWKSMSFRDKLLTSGMLDLGRDASIFNNFSDGDEEESEELVEYKVY